MPDDKRCGTCGWRDGDARCQCPLPGWAVEGWWLDKGERVTREDGYDCECWKRKEQANG